MKIVITTTSPSIDSNVDNRFGRCAFFLFVDPVTLEWDAKPNPGVNARGGAGVKASQFVANLKPDAIISGSFGPNAYGVLKAANVQMYLFDGAKNVQEVINRFNEGILNTV